MYIIGEARFWSQKSGGYQHENKSIIFFVPRPGAYKLASAYYFSSLTKEFPGVDFTKKTLFKDLLCTPILFIQFNLP
jgi:hypothetical protein